MRLVLSAAGTEGLRASQISGKWFAKIMQRKPESISRKNGEKIIETLRQDFVPNFLGTKSECNINSCFISRIFPMIF